MKDIGRLISIAAGGLLILMYLLAVLNSEGMIFDYNYGNL